MTIQDQDAGKRWHVVVSKPHAEKLALGNLANQHFETYLPLAITEGKPVRGKPNLHIRPMFPRYIFVRFNADIAAWRSIFNTRGVDKMFMAGDRPARFPDRDIEIIRAHEEGGFVKFADPEQLASRFKRGDAVKVRRNKTDIDAVFEELIDNERAIILVHLLGRESRQKVTLISLR